MSTTLIPNEFNIVFNSNPSLGALPIGTKGNKFSVRFDEPVSIPLQSQAPTIELVSSAVWNNSPNILTGVNDKLSIIISATTTVITFPQGSYSVSDINTYVNEQLVAANPAWVNYVTISADATVGKVRVTSNNIAFTDFIVTTDARHVAFGTLIGWTADQAFTAAGQYFTGADVAQINNVDNFLIHLSLVQNGIPINGVYSQVLAAVPITVDPGQLINYEPTNTIKIPAYNLRGATNTNFLAWITNQNNEDIIMPDYWSFTTKISWLDSKITV